MSLSKGQLETLFNLEKRLLQLWARLIFQETLLVSSFDSDDVVSHSFHLENVGFLLLSKTYGKLFTFMEGLFAIHAAN
jgi:hypothetical protein